MPAIDHPPANPPAGSRSRRANGAVGQAPAATPPGISSGGCRHAVAAPLPAAPAGQPAGAPVKPVPAVLPAVVATVNGENVQRWELETALKQAEANAGGPVPADQTRRRRAQHPRRAAHVSHARAGSAQPEKWTSRKPRSTPRWRPSARTSPPRTRSSRRSCCRASPPSNCGR